MTSARRIALAASVVLLLPLAACGNEDKPKESAPVASQPQRDDTYSSRTNEPQPVRFDGPRGTDQCLYLEDEKREVCEDTSAPAFRLSSKLKWRVGGRDTTNELVAYLLGAEDLFSGTIFETYVARLAAANKSALPKIKQTAAYKRGLEDAKPAPIEGFDESTENGSEEPQDESAPDNGDYDSDYDYDDPDKPKSKQSKPPKQPSLPSSGSNSKPKSKTKF